MSDVRKSPAIYKTTQVEFIRRVASSKAPVSLLDLDETEKAELEDLFAKRIVELRYPSGAPALVLSDAAKLVFFAGFGLGATN